MRAPGSDVVGSSVRTGRDQGPGGAAFVAFQLTRGGQKRFHRLTAGLARRGAAVHRVQHFAFALDGRIYARPWVDYRATPGGLDASAGVEIAGVPPRIADRVAAALRRGSRR